MRMRKFQYIILPKYGQKLPKEHVICLFQTNHYCYFINSVGSRIDGILFPSFQNQDRSQKNTILFYYYSSLYLQINTNIQIQKALRKEKKNKWK